MSGKPRRLSRIFDHDTGRTIIVPIDDSLIAGPEDGLLNLHAKVSDIASGLPNAVLGFPGHFEQYGDLLRKTAWIFNLTASTTRSCHTRKVQILSVRQAVALGADCVAAHVNITSKYEYEMISMLSRIIEDARNLGMPVLAIMYPRTERADGSDDNHDELKLANPDEYARLVSHCVRVAKDLGAEIIKTQYTGSSKTFKMVVEAAHPIPVAIAGGPLVSPHTALTAAAESISAGGRGISFGRNIFNRRNSAAMIKALTAAMTGNASPDELVGQIYE